MRNGNTSHCQWLSCVNIAPAFAPHANAAVVLVVAAVRVDELFCLPRSDTIRCRSMNCQRPARWPVCRTARRRSWRRRSPPVPAISSGKQDESSGGEQAEQDVRDQVAHDAALPGSVIMPTAATWLHSDPNLPAGQLHFHRPTSDLTSYTS